MQNNLGIVGIDFSLNYTCIAILDSSDYFFCSITREENLSKKQKEIITDLEKLGKFKNFYINKFKEGNDYQENQLLKIKDIKIISDIILNILKEQNINNIKLEGLSYSSLGQRSLDLAGYNYILRYLIVENFRELKIVAPSSIKKTAGKGNLNKVGMFESFISNKLDDNILTGNEIYKYILNKKEIFNKNKKTIVEPVAGLIDSYFILHS